MNRGFVKLPFKKWRTFLDKHGQEVNCQRKKIGFQNHEHG